MELIGGLLLDLFLWAAKRVDRWMGWGPQLRKDNK
jgi:hypothetical protein